MVKVQRYLVTKTTYRTVETTKSINGVLNIVSNHSTTLVTSTDSFSFRTETPQLPKGVTILKWL